MSGNATKRRAAYRRGIEAEAQAADLYRERKYDIAGTRVRTAAGEIDIVAANGDTVAFVEVKRRASLDGAAEAVDPRQKARIVRAAMLWMADNPRFAAHNMRFDAVLLAPRGQRRHIVDAFQADGVDFD